MGANSEDCSTNRAQSIAIGLVNKRKQEILTKKILYKWKACLNIHVGKNYTVLTILNSSCNIQDQDDLNGYLGVIVSQDTERIHLLQEAIHIKGMSNELTSNRFQMPHGPTKVKCVAFEDNIGAIEQACLPKLRS